MSELISSIYKTLDKAEPCRILAGAVSESLGKFRRIGVKGLRASSLALVSSWLSESTSCPPPSMIFVIVGTNDHASEMADDLAFFNLHGIRPYHWTKPEALPYDADDSILENQIKHLELLDVLARLKKGEKFKHPLFAVSCVEALMWRVPSLENTERARFEIERAGQLDPQTFEEEAAKLGYQRVSTVEVRGEFAIRGGIVDVFPVTANMPYRIDLFGNDIESIYPFDTTTQRSNKTAAQPDRVELLPTNERVVFGETYDDASVNQPFPCLLELLPPDALLVLDAAETWKTQEERFNMIITHRFREHGSGKAAPKMLFADLGDLEKALSRHTQIHHSLLLESKVGRTITFATKSFEAVKPDFALYNERAMAQLKGGRDVIMVCDNDGQTKRLAELLNEQETPAEIYLQHNRKYNRLPEPLEPGTGTYGCVVVTVGDMNAGFTMADCGLMMVTDREIFGRYKRRYRVRTMASRSMPVADPREIKPGDHVVHLDHGIAIFNGIRTIEFNNKWVDTFELEFADRVLLKVPVERINLIHKYSAGDNVVPVLDTLGGKRWQTRKRKGQEEIEKYARQLAELYARRSMMKGQASPPDTSAQRTFEEAFLYNETRDQLTAIHDVKRDMMSNKVMDRLVVGDVGYGKTEVAIRAAFKAIQNGQQVALLCPTTVLCQQHYNNFRERFADHAIKLEMISRFKTQTEIRKIKAAIADGSVDMVIGTHGLLSKTMTFKNLGLLIVDEEHRFGVTQKERLRELKRGTDCLTLTATPIPRTLYMSLSHVRDMSIINTPPADRLPIHTRVVHWDRDVITEALMRELNRGGQVFYVHNHVETIYETARMISEIVPQARVVVGHGQMNEEELENVMMEFVDGKYDILVSTTIIESGMDIPNVNTIIMDRADMYGLAQLYQLRGRVGRQSRQAYAYLLLPKNARITDQAVQRLAAIQEFSSLGSGFKLAMRDMEIRGVGNLLGKEQHGTVCKIGFELYCKMLDDAVERLQAQMDAGGDGTTDKRPMSSDDVEVRWTVSASLPKEYLPEEAQRMTFYKRIADARTTKEIDAIAAELEDRFGCVEKPSKIRNADGTPKHIVRELPGSVKNLLSVAKIRILASKLFIDRVSATSNGYKLHSRFMIDILKRGAARLPRNNKRFSIYIDDPNTLEFAYQDWEKYRKLATCVRMLTALAEIIGVPV